MAIFNDIGKKIGDTAQNAVKKSGDMVEITKINMSIKSEEESIESLYTEIGKQYYSKFGDNTDLDATLTELCTRVKNHQSAIDSFKDKIIQLKNINVCKNCGHEMSKNVAFCSQCGTKAEPEKTEIKPEVLEELCPNCKARIKEGAAFCAQCGTRVK